jgi:hypothetical protein
VLAYLVSRHPAGMEDTYILIDGRVDRESARQGLAKALRWMVLEVLVGDKMCFPLFRPFHASSMMNRLKIRNLVVARGGIEPPTRGFSVQGLK